jgi:hypothetical protein|nr:MAG TPA: hypothetical protein [Caudoviricetes sp.]
MGIRNSEELGTNLSKIALRLLKNQNLCKYLIYTDDSPLNNPDILDPVKDILHKNIKIVPQVNAEENSSKSTVVITYNKAIVDESNTEFKYVDLFVLVYVPLSEWVINDINLRPFSIISEIEKSLKDKKVEGLGKLKYQGWEVDVITDRYSIFKMGFNLYAFD